MDRELTRHAMQLICRFGDASATKPEIDSQAIASLIALLQSIAVCDEMDDDSYEELFGDGDPVETGVMAIEILANHDVVDAIASIVDFVAWQVSRNEHGDYLLDDISDALAAFDTEGILSLLEHAVLSGRNEAARGVLIQAVKQWGDYQEAAPKSVEALISQGLDNAPNNSIRVNTDLMMLVIDWKLKGFGEMIERAFSLDRIDCGMIGDWDTVKRLLHVAGRGLPMPKRPYNSMLNFRKRIGIGVFSKKFVFMHGEIQEEAASEYLDNAKDAFSSCDEGQRLQNDGQKLGYVYNFLEIGLRHFRATVDSMTVADARAILLEVFPRTVSIESNDCINVVDELCAFWHFVDRVHQLESAKKIETEIRALLAEFRQEMSAPKNYAMAKSIVMAAKAEGYDIISQEDMHKFMAVYNARISANIALQMGNQDSTSRVDQPTASSVSGMSLKQRKKLLAKMRRK